MSAVGDRSEAERLLTAEAVRDAANGMFLLAADWGLPQWGLDLSRMDAVADLTAETVRANYPDLKVPFHARWRHFNAGGRDLWAEADKPSDPMELGRAAFNLIIPSVLLDAGAGTGWRYRDVTGAELSRSEGLGVASLRMWQSGALDDLSAVTAGSVAEAFQVSDDNPLVGVEGRAALLRRVGEAVGQPSRLFDMMVARAVRGVISGPDILEVLLVELGPIWPGRLKLGGLPLGDCWPHPVAGHGLVPLHKLSQWMSYSLIEPLQWAGIKVINIDGLTGLAEYRNGGLFIDGGVLRLRNPADERIAHPVDSELVVGWRALTVALLDRIAPMVRERLGVSAEAFPLACVLEGGTWAAGRRIAASLRADGGPPIKVISDGTVF
jgi:Protein of unknown function (DUF1688)